MSFYKANKKPLLHGNIGHFSRKRNERPPAEDLAAAQTTREKKHVSPATVTTLPCCETRYLAAYVCGKSTNELLQSKQKAFFTRNPWRLFAQTKRRACCTGSCCRNGTVGDFIRRPNEGPPAQDLAATTRGKNHISPATVATVTTLPQCETGYLAAYVCGKSTNELLQTKQKVFFTRNRWRFFPQTKRRACCTESCCRNGTFGDFIRRPNAGPLAQDFAAAQTTRGKHAHFSRNCYNTAALQDRIYT